MTKLLQMRNYSTDQPNKFQGTTKKIFKPNIFVVKNFDNRTYQNTISKRFKTRKFRMWNIFALITKTLQKYKNLGKRVFLSVKTNKQIYTVS